MSSFIELRCKTHYSFLRGASHPHELIGRAIELGMTGLAITDLHGIYGLPKAYLAAKTHPQFKLLSGAQLQLSELPPLTLIAQNREGYGLLCRILTEAHHGKPKGEARLDWQDFKALMTLPGNTKLIAIPDEISDKVSDEGHSWNWQELKNMYGSRLYYPLSRWRDGHDKKRTQKAHQMSNHYGIKIIASNDVHYHTAQRRDLQDVLTCIREGVTLESAGYLLFSNQERDLKSPQEMAKLFSDLPEALSNTLEAAESCHFSLSELRYHYPSEWIPAGSTAQSHLTDLVWKGAEKRYQGSIPVEMRTQIEYELKLIHELKFADYFLTIWEIVEFSRQKDILCQGRGSAANSAVCYVLGITAINPIQMKLLFERFISAERGEPPDIDVDFEHERREEIIQHIYEKYGRHRAAMVAAVITYRSRSAIREVTRVFGHEMDKRDFLKLLEAPSPSPRILLQNKLIEELKGFPRHLSIHSGGFTLSSEPMIEIVPVEPARMEGRTIVQWDKNDLDALGLLKVDILALGMLTALKKAMRLIGSKYDLYSVPPDDADTYKMIQNADTIGTFQIESRAQMSMLPRLLPKNFYELVVEIALVRPGPIVGKMVHPYLRRKKGLEPITLPDPRLEPILNRTLGVPIFQEQVMQIAIDLADFTPGESDQLRRAIGAWRSSGSIDEMGRRLMKGLLVNGIPQDFAERVFLQIQGFAEYGFPESHAASFALIAYCSAYFKCHYPAEFTCGLLNSQPMGFYAPHTLVDDVKRHGVQVFPIHPNISDWESKIENGGIRLGFQFITGVSKKEIKNLLEKRTLRPFTSLKDFLDRSSLRKPTLHRLALGDAFSCFQYDQRRALWQILAYEILNFKDEGQQMNLFTGVDFSTQRDTSASPHSSALARASFPFSSMDEYESILSDYQSYGLSTRGHPMQFIRKKYKGLPPMTTAQAKQGSNGTILSLLGLSVVMQRPPTASGTVFATLEDETGFLDIIIHHQIFEKYKELILDHSFLIVTGKIQRDGLSVSLILRSIKPFPTHNLSISRYLSEGVRS
jgi:error-prone DNA polymerase